MKILLVLVSFLFLSLNLFAGCQESSSSNLSFCGWAHFDGKGWVYLERNVDGTFKEVAKPKFEKWNSEKTEYPVLVARDQNGEFLKAPVYAEDKVFEKNGKYEKWLFYRVPDGEQGAGQFMKTQKLCDIGECDDDIKFLGGLIKITSTSGKDKGYKIGPFYLLPESKGVAGLFYKVVNN